MIKKSPGQNTSYYPTVDFLRGLGALVILVWHYHHFYFTKPYFSAETGQPTWVYEAQPFYQILWPFYHHGAWAVQFFWLLSGFVFAHVYASKKTSAHSFFVLRLSRLYPLHIITLLTITALQAISHFHFGQFQILAINDAYHFFLHLFFASNWGFEKGYSFNSPVWSISVEEVAYWFFWLVAARKGNLTSQKSIVLTIAAFLLLRNSGLIGQCIFYFFSGATAYLLHQSAQNTQKRVAIIIGSMAIACACFLQHMGYIDSIKMKAKYHPQVLHAAMMFSFLSLMLFAALLDELKTLKKFNGEMLFLGSVTYSTYLWHLPIQVLVIMLMDAMQYDRSVFNSGVALMTFIVSMIVIGRLSYTKIEQPIQLLMRKRLLQGSAASMDAEVSPVQQRGRLPQ